MSDDSPSVDQLTSAYIKIREARSALKKRFDAEDAELKAQLEQVGAALLEYCADTGVESARTAHGTFYRTTKTRYWATDWAAVYKFMQENEVPELLEKRLSQGTMKQLMEEDNITVPGVNVDTEYVITVRKK